MTATNLFYFFIFYFVRLNSGRLIFVFILLNAIQRMAFIHLFALRNWALIVRLIKLRSAQVLFPFNDISLAVEGLLIGINKILCLASTCTLILRNFQYNISFSDSCCLGQYVLSVVLDHNAAHPKSKRQRQGRFFVFTARIL